MKLYEHQGQALEQTKGFNKVAYYLDMGLGKTFVGSEKMMQLDSKVNLVICQKSKIDDWIDHFVQHYELKENMMIYDCTKWKKNDWQALKNDVNFDSDWHNKSKYLLIINYDLVFRRSELLQLEHFTLMPKSCLITHHNYKVSAQCAL